MQKYTSAQDFWGCCLLGSIKDCWFWCGKKDSDGYGICYIDGKQRKAHRIAYELTAGQPVTGTTLVQHRCGVRVCCNPHHLEGVPQAGPRLHGAANGRAKLSEAAVVAIRRRRAAGEPVTKLAAEYRVSPSTISRIARRKTWNGGSNIF